MEIKFRKEFVDEIIELVRAGSSIYAGHGDEICLADNSHMNALNKYIEEFRKIDTLLKQYEDLVINDVVDLAVVYAEIQNMDKAIAESAGG